MNVKDITKGQIRNGGGSYQLIRIAVICLAGVSLYTTAQGMTQYIFHNDTAAYAASAAIQGILLAMSMGLLKYIRGIWKNNWHVLLRLFTCIMIILLTIVTMFCSSWFSYIYIAEIVHFDSWGTDSELLVQQTYRAELYNARDYAHTYRIYLESDMGEKILMLEEQADAISKKEKLDSPVSNWEEEMATYGDTNTMAGNYMSTVIDAMRKAMEQSSGNSRELAAKAVMDAQENIRNRMTDIQQNLDRLDETIASYEEQIARLRNSINNAVPGTNTSSLTNSLNNFVQRIEEETAAQAALREENSQLEEASKRLKFYESWLGLNDASSSIAIRNTLLEMQTEFFQEDPDEAQLLATATSIFENIRNAASYNDDNSLSYTNLLVQMNQLILNLKDYTDIKEIESSLDNLIVELREEKAIDFSDEEADGGNSPDETEQDKTNSDKTKQDKTDSNKWKNPWNNRLEALKSQISSMPMYSAQQTTNGEGTGILTESQLNILRTYDRKEASDQLDDMIRLYIANHNALYQGIIYLLSPYKMLALFSLILAFAFDMSGFILGFVNQGEIKKNTGFIEDKPSAGIKKQMANKEENGMNWSVIPPLNKYKVLTGDYEKKDNVYIYQVFENGLLTKWNIEDSVPYVQGIYMEDKTLETKGILVSATEQSVLFTNQPEGPRDGIYLNCRLEFEEGSLFLVREAKQAETKSFLANVNEYVPIHSYNPSKGENQTIPAVQLSSDRIEAHMVILALNDKGTRIAAVYMMEYNN